MTNNYTISNNKSFNIFIIKEYNYSSEKACIFNVFLLNLFLNISEECCEFSVCFDELSQKPLTLLFFIEYKYPKNKYYLIPYPIEYTFC